MFNVQLRQLRWWVKKKKKGTGCATLSLLTTPTFDVHLIQLWYLEWAFGWSLSEAGAWKNASLLILCLMKTEKNNWKIWQKLYQHPWLRVCTCHLLFRSITQVFLKLHLLLACLVRSCWQDCVLSSVQPFFLPNVGRRAQHETVWNFSRPGWEERPWHNVSHAQTCLTSPRHSRERGNDDSLEHEHGCWKYAHLGMGCGLVHRLN